VLAAARRTVVLPDDYVLPRVAADIHLQCAQLPVLATESADRCTPRWPTGEGTHGGASFPPSVAEQSIGHDPSMSRRLVEVAALTDRRMRSNHCWNSPRPTRSTAVRSPPRAGASQLLAVR
jgi:hypothetical protein